MKTQRHNAAVPQPNFSRRSGLAFGHLRQVNTVHSAAKRRKTIATANGRGFSFIESMSRVSGERIFRRSAAHPTLGLVPRPPAVATVLRRSAAANK